MDSCLGVDSKQVTDPLLVDQSMGESEQNKIPVRKSFNQISKLLIIGFCLCVDFERGLGLTLPDQGVVTLDRRFCQHMHQWVPLEYYRC